MGSLNDQSAHFVTIPAKMGGNFENYFQKFLYENYLLVGVYRLCAKNERERIVVTLPLKSFKVDKDDFLIALKAPARGRTIPSFMNRKEEEEIVEEEEKKKPKTTKTGKSAKSETTKEEEEKASNLSVASKCTTVTSEQMTMVK